MTMKKKIKRFWIIILLLLFNSSTSAETVLTTFFQADAGPRYFKHDGQVVGICVDIIDELNKRLRHANLKIIAHHEYFPTQRMFNYLAEGKADLFVGMTKTEKRTQIYRFSDIPLYNIPYVFAKNKEDSFEYTGLKSLKGKRISCLRGTNSCLKIGEILGAVQDDLDGLEQIIRKLSKGRTDLAIYHKLGLQWIIRNLDLQGRIMLIGKSFKNRYQHIAYRPTISPDIIVKLDHILRSMHRDGTIERIMANYR
jgi:polar amino acid transport system substrate-binding protein